MSNHNYKQYYNKNNEEQKPVIPPVVDVEPEVPVTPVVDVEPVVEPEIPVVEPEIPTPVNGKVVNCKMLNIRVAPKKTADVVTVVNEGTNLVIDNERSVGDWYGVCTVAGIEGYCMKEFVEL